MSFSLINRNELAELLRTSPSYISNQVSLLNEGKTIPPSIKLGSRRLWNRLTVDLWIKQKEQQSISLLEQKRALTQ